MEVCKIIAFHEALKKEFSATQLLWHPSHSDQKYRCNADLSETLEAVMTIVKECIAKDVPVLHLTAFDGFVYFSEE